MTGGERTVILVRIGCLIDALRGFGRDPGWEAQRLRSSVERALRSRVR